MLPESLKVELVGELGNGEGIAIGHLRLEALSLVHEDGGGGGGGGLSVPKNNKCY